MQLSLFEQTVLDAVDATGTTQGCYRQVAGAFSLTTEQMAEKVFRGDKAGFVNRWQHKIRSTQACLKQKGLVINGSNRGEWQVTEKGRQNLTFAPKNSMKLYFTTASGMAFWGDASLLSQLFQNEINLIVTSPPYLLSKAREYGSLGQKDESYVASMTKMIESWLPMLTSDASIVINLGPGTQKGTGYQSLYRERLLIELEDKLGLHLLQRFHWISPSKMPSGYWTTRAKRNVVDVTEDFYWLSLNPKHTKANNQNVLVEFSETQKRYMASAAKKSYSLGRLDKPSGQSANLDTFYSQRDGAIPNNLLYAAPESANSNYSQQCRENNIPRHNAMFHKSLPEFFIRFLTAKNDVVCDPFVGSGNTGQAAEDNERFWIGSDIVRESLDGAKLRFSC